MTILEHEPCNIFIYKNHFIHFNIIKPWQNKNEFSPHGLRCRRIKLLLVLASNSVWTLTSDGGELLLSSPRVWSQIKECVSFPG